MDWDRLKQRMPELLDWDRLTVRVIKDPERPMSVVSDLGVVHGGMERDSAVYRLSDGAASFVVKRHDDPVLFRRETANIRFVNEAGAFAPQLLAADAETGVLVMENLGDRALAVLWKDGRMDEYRRRVHEAVEVSLRVQAHWHGHPERLTELYGDLGPEGPPKAHRPEEAVEHLDAALRISRGTGLADVDRDALWRVGARMGERLERFDATHREFGLGLTPWHIILKDRKVRVIDLTFPPIGSALGQFENCTWHLDGRHAALGHYLDGRRRLGLPAVDSGEFLLLTDWLHVVGCLLWIKLYAEGILEGEPAMAGMDGSPLTDYAANEGANLQAIYRTLAPYDELSAVTDILTRHFAMPRTL